MQVLIPKFKNNGWVEICSRQNTALAKLQSEYSLNSALNFF